MARMNTAYRAYMRRFLPTMAIYVGLVTTAPYVIRAVGADSPLRWFIAIAPALPIIAVFWIIGRLLTELDDEYLRMLEIRKALVATGFALSLATLWGFLEVAGMVDHIPLFFVPIAWFAGLGVGSLVNAVAERPAR